jgi:phosphohistidine swiveling domain-containing protein
MSVVGVVVHDEVVDAIEVQLFFVGTDDGLGYHLSVAELRLDMHVVIQTEVHVARIHNHGPVAFDIRRLPNRC